MSEVVIILTYAGACLCVDRPGTVSSETLSEFNYYHQGPHHNLTIITQLGPSYGSGNTQNIHRKVGSLMTSKKVKIFHILNFHMDIFTRMKNIKNKYLTFNIIKNENTKLFHNILKKIIKQTQQDPGK